MYIRNLISEAYSFPVSILCKSISGRHRPVRVVDGPMTPDVDSHRMLAGLPPTRLTQRTCCHNICNVLADLLWQTFGYFNLYLSLGEFSRRQIDDVFFIFYLFIFFYCFFFFRKQALKIGPELLCKLREKLEPFLGNRFKRIFRNAVCWML